MITEINTALTFFINTFVQLAVLFICISFIVSIIDAKLPVSRVSQLLNGERGYFIAISLGALTPFCSCSTMPMTIGLLNAKVAFGQVMAFLFTSPLLNPFIVGLFGLVFGLEVTLVYSTCVVFLAFLSGYLLEKFQFERFIRADFVSNEDAKNRDKNKTTCAAKPATVDLLPLFFKTLSQFISFMPYMLIGVAIGAILHGFIPEAVFNQFNQYHALVSIPLTAFIGVFLYIRASTMIPIASALVAKGMSLGSVISLTVAGAGASLPEMIMLKRLFHWPLLFAFVGVVFTTACITGLIIEVFYTQTT